jgi:hypothetical protein
VKKALAGRVDAYKPLSLTKEVEALKAVHACLTHAQAQARFTTVLAQDQALLKRLQAGAGAGAGDAKGKVEAGVDCDPGRLTSAVTSDSRTR